MDPNLKPLPDPTQFFASLQAFFESVDAATESCNAGRFWTPELRRMDKALGGARAAVDRICAVVKEQGKRSDRLNRENAIFAKRIHGLRRHEWANQRNAAWSHTVPLMGRSDDPDGASRHDGSERP